MSTKGNIAIAITMKVGTTSLDVWRIGLTRDPAERKRSWEETENQNVNSWADWEADSLEEAQDIERVFIKNGMNGGAREELSPQDRVFVYVF
jgi:hypothetical protein